MNGTFTWALWLIGVGSLILAASYFSPTPPRPKPRYFLNVEQ
jgi:hypothetical protein